MKRLLVLLLSLTAAVVLPFVSSIAHSEEACYQGASVATDATTAKYQMDGTVKGEVLKIDNDMLKIVIKHQELRCLGMPAMTMVFNVPDRSLLEGVKEGGKIKFAAQVTPNGLSVTKLESESN
ncbi:copper-binding protein [Noviherbaspirillum suwonense]|uniref:Copper binding protein CusF n=1 Tax=Noviherbaspirillum suwonense TaxID=1224511 RepID=A0ABY1QJD5_9BURK|nr:copper-binding protein [Noviherbaspirillum suwonense]SMP72384.1 Copper binding protein CusF [Noviherbaspirillum suwonense]